MCHASKYGTPFKHTQSANVSIEAFKIVSRIGFNKTAARCAAIKNKEKLLERLDRPILDLRGYLISDTTSITAGSATTSITHSSLTIE
jgi:hypothetical protein